MLGQFVITPQAGCKAAIEHGRTYEVQGLLAYAARILITITETVFVSPEQPLLLARIDEIVTLLGKGDINPQSSAALTYGANAAAICRLVQYASDEANERLDNPAVSAAYDKFVGALVEMQKKTLPGIPAEPIEPELPGVFPQAIARVKRSPLLIAGLGFGAGAVILGLSLWAGRTISEREWLM